MGKITGALSKPFILLIRTYRYFLSPLLGNCCRFSPSCSSYAITAFERWGCLHGCYLTLKRVLRCHPFTDGGYDPVPEPEKTCRPI